MVFAGVLSALGFYLILLQMDIRKVCGYHVAFDVGLSILLILLYQGTYSGMVVGFVGGVTLTGLLWFTKGLIGFKRYEHGEWRYSIGW
jgi:hypothetical protein